MEGKEMRMQQFRTPQHPSTQKDHYWGTHELQQFRTPQHPSTAANQYWGVGAQSLRFDYGTHQNHRSMGAIHRGGADSLRFDYGTPQHHAAMGANHRSGPVSLRFDNGTPQHHASMGANHRSGSDSLRFDYGTPQDHASMEANHRGGSDSLRIDYGTPQPENLGVPKYWEYDSTSEVGSPRSRAAKNYWGTVDGRRPFGTALSPAAFRTKNTPERRDLILQFVSSPAVHLKNVLGTPDRIRQFGTPQHRRSFRQFRTPQHPSQGTNYWGGASPLLARNIPKESLEKRYERLNTIRTQDAIFTLAEEGDHDDNSHYSSSMEAQYRYEYSTPNAASIPHPNPSKRSGGLLWKWMKKKQDSKALGNPSKKKKKWFWRFYLRKRWLTRWF